MNASSVVRVSALLLSLVVVAPAQPAAGHGVLLESVPMPRETVTVVKRLDLRFNSRIEPGFSGVRLIAPSGEEMRLHAVVSETAGPNWLTASLPPLGPGLYTVRWRVFTLDGHLSNGSFAFRVAERR